MLKVILDIEIISNKQYSKTCLHCTLAVQTQSVQCKQVYNVSRFSKNSSIIEGKSLKWLSKNHTNLRVNIQAELRNFMTSDTDCAFVLFILHVKWIM